MAVTSCTETAPRTRAHCTVRYPQFIDVKDHGRQHISMSLSPTISNGPENNAKRRRTDSQNFAFQPGMNGLSQPLPNGQQGMAQVLPKRGQRACTACRKGKNRCEGDVSVIPSSRLTILTGPPAAPARLIGSKWNLQKVPTFRDRMYI